MVHVRPVRLELDLGEEGAKQLAAAAAGAREQHCFQGTGWRGSTNWNPRKKDWEKGVGAGPGGRVTGQANKDREKRVGGGLGGPGGGAGERGLGIGGRVGPGGALTGRRDTTWQG